MAREDDREALIMDFKKLWAELLGLKMAADHVAMLQDRLSKAERDGLDRDEVLDAYTSALKRMVAPEEAEK